MFRSADMETARAALSNWTQSLNGTMATMMRSNMTARNSTAGNGTEAGGPILRAFEGLVQNPGAAVENLGFGQLLKQLSGVVQSAAQPLAAFQGQAQQAASLFRSALNDTNSTMNATTTMNSTAGSSNDTRSAMPAASKQKQRSPKRRLLWTS